MQQRQIPLMIYRDKNIMKQKKEDRKCEICGKTLSRYNPDKECFHHTIDRRYKKDESKN